MARRRGPGAVVLAGPGLGQEPHRLRLHLEADAQGGEPFPGLGEHLLGDGGQGLAVQGVEHQGGVQAVEELRGEGVPGLPEHRLLQGGAVGLRPLEKPSRAFW